ncbi:MAG: bifunctional pyr operon transcriptional regulator/uracil phosphoribosyltransferase PyrR [Cyclobacteriaceae bacterium]|nr:bifunctional pyr operon transcriptional regulator/uracil phosphoribosyltransferase PyrR [Cyclobacteriaceae bacterium]
MQKKLLLDEKLLNITLHRLGQQLIENHGNFKDTVLIGLQPRGIFLADLIRDSLGEMGGINPQTGYLDTTFHRDDFRRRENPAKPSSTNIDFIIEDKRVVLIDDVLYTGRSVRAALDAMITFGRPRQVELLALVNRRYSRELPIEADYIGTSVHTLNTQKVLVELKAQGFETNSIWLVNKE